MVEEDSVRDALELIEECYERGWTDGLPVVPPTASGLERMIHAAGRDPHEALGVLAPKDGILTVEKVALNALMAGCKPEYMPVVIAAAEAIVDPKFNLRFNSRSTRGPAPLLVINGPIRQQLGINCRSNVFGPGWRANATIGRAVRLLIRNVGGALPGEMDRATLGHPGKYTYCIGEDEEHSPWEPLHVERGFAKEDSVVTVISCEGPNQFGVAKGTADMILEALVEALRSIMRFSSNYRGIGDVTIVFDTDQRNELVKAGYSKADVRRHIFANTWRTAGEARRFSSPLTEDSGAEIPDHQPMHLFTSEKTIYIIAAGAGNRFGAFMPTWRSIPGVAEPVSRRIRDLE